MAHDRFGIALNLKLNAHTQYAGFNFNSMAVFNGVVLGANEDGLFTLNDSETDAGEDIRSIVEMVGTDFGAQNSKRMRRVDIGLKAQGDLVLTLKSNEDEGSAYPVRPAQLMMKQHRTNVPVGSRQRGTYWAVRLENRNGHDFSVDAIDLVAVVLGRKR